jgi:hypothetical protein
MMKTQEIDGQTYSLVDGETYRDGNGGEWILWEREDMITKVEWAEKEMARLAGHLEDEDAASAYLEALETKAGTEEDLRIIEELWAL